KIVSCCCHSVPSPWLCVYAAASVPRPDCQIKYVERRRYRTLSANDSRIHTSSLNAGVASIPHHNVPSRTLGSTLVLRTVVVSWHDMRLRRYLAVSEARALLELPEMGKDWCSHETAPVDRNVWDRQIDRDQRSWCMWLSCSGWYND